MAKWVQCTEGPWEVSDEGQMRLSENRSSRRKGHIIKFFRQSGRLRTVLSGHDGKKKSYALHSMVAKYHLPKRPGPKFVISMIDRDITNCRASNLKWTDWDVVCRNGVPAPTDATVRKIRRLHAEGMKLVDIAKKVPFSYAIIQRIASGRYYKRVK